jgi:hypothetical protein
MSLDGNYQISPYSASHVYSIIAAFHCSVFTLIPSNIKMTIFSCSRGRVVEFDVECGNPFFQRSQVHVKPEGRGRVMNIYICMNLDET